MQDFYFPLATLGDCGEAGTWFTIFYSIANPAFILGDFYSPSSTSNTRTRTRLQHARPTHSGPGAPGKSAARARPRPLHGLLPAALIRGHD